MSLKFWPTVYFCSYPKGGKYAPYLCLTYLLFWQWNFTLVFTGCIVTSHWVPGHPTHLPCTEQYSAHCTVHCILYCTINCNQTSKWLAELTYLMRNNHFTASCILQLTLLYTVLNIILHTVLYNKLYIVLYTVPYTLLYKDAGRGKRYLKYTVYWTDQCTVNFSQYPSVQGIKFSIQYNIKPNIQSNVLYSVHYIVH